MLAQVPVVLGGFLVPLEHARLKQSSVYALARHPVYGGLILASLGWSATWLSLPGLGFRAVVALFFDRKSAFEEKLPRARYPEYHDCTLRVRKLLPWIY